MLKFIQFLKSLTAKGFATKEEKEALKVKFTELSEEEQEAVKEDVETAEALPEEEVKEEAVSPEDVEKSLKSLLAPIVSELKSEVQDFITEQRALSKKGTGIYQSNIKESRAEANKRIKTFVNALIENNVATLRELEKNHPRFKEMTTDDTGSPYAGYVVDSELDAEIKHLITEYGVAAREMEAVQLRKGDYKVNELVTDVTVSWADEAGSLLSTQVVLGQNTLSLKKLYALVTMTYELLEDSEIDLMAFIAGRVAEGIAYKEDLAFFNGDGTSTYGSFTGLLQDTDVSATTLTGTTFASMDADDLIDLQDSLAQGAQANAKYYMHRTILSIVRKLKGTTNDHYIYQRPSDNLPATIWDKPVVLVEAMPSSSDTAADTAFVLYGDLRKACIYGYKGTIRAELFNTGTVRNVANSADINLLTSDRKAIRFIRRVGYVLALGDAVVRLKTASASA